MQTHTDRLLVEKTIDRRTDGQTNNVSIFLMVQSLIDDEHTAIFLVSN